MALAILVAIFLTVALGREFMLVKLSGWQRLSRKYRCRAPFPGKCRACWWAQFIKPGPKREIVVNVGRLTRWPFRLEFPPYWDWRGFGWALRKAECMESIAPSVADSMGEYRERGRIDVQGFGPEDRYRIGRCS